MKKILLLLTALFVVLGTYGQAISPDPSFAGKGWTLTDFSKGNTYSEYGRTILVQNNGSSIIAFTIRPYTMLVRLLPDGTIDRQFGQEGFSVAAQLYLSNGIQQADGKIVVAGYVSTQGSNDFALARFNLDGTLDNSFGSNGSLHTDFSGGSETAYSLALQTDGKIVVAGWTAPPGGTNDFALARYNPDGSLDTSFDADGKLATDFYGSTEYAFDVAIQPDGKIVVAGYAYNGGTSGNDFALVRYNPGGSLDKSFGHEGRVSTDFGADEYAQSLALQPDGRLVVAGEARSANWYTSDFALARYTPDGVLDETFNGDGWLVTDMGGSDVVYSLALQSDGKIIAGGYTNVSGDLDFALARYNEDGSVDNSFGTEGKVTTAFEGYDIIYSLALQDDGNILATGMANGGQYHDISVARYRPDGSLDASFGTGGKLRVYYPASRSIFFSGAVQPDEKIVVAGTAANTMTNYDYALARYHPDGELDTNFGTGGKVTTSVGLYDYAHSVVVQSDGKILAAGCSGDPDDRQNYQVILVRYLAGGSIDKDFGTKGKLVTDLLGSGNLRGSPLALQGDGKIVVGGAAALAENVDMALARYLPDGSPDHGFGQGGKVTTDFFGNYDMVTDVAIQKDGKIVVSGRVYDRQGYGDFFALARYNPDGSLDNSFGNDGKVTTPLSGTPLALVLQEDGKLVVAGGFSDIALVRYNTDGSLDSSFDGDGKKTINFGTGSYTQSVAVQGNRKLVVAGYMINPLSRFYDIFLVRFHEDGSLDESLGDGGKQTYSYGRLDFAAFTWFYKNRLYVAGYSTLLNQSGLLAAYRLDCGDKEICGNRLDDNCDGQVDEGCPATPFLTINDVTVSEDLQRATLMVTLSKKMSDPVSFSYFTQDRTAVSKPNKGARDFEAESGTLTIPAGQQTAVISINILDDNLTEGGEYFDVHLQRPVGAALSGDKGRVTIQDGQPSVGIGLTSSVPEKEERQGVNGLTATAQPNPSAGAFTLVLQSSNSAPVTLKVTDAAGRLLEAKAGIAANATLQIGSSYRPGVYYVELVQGIEKVSLKLVKQSN